MKTKNNLELLKCKLQNIIEMSNKENDELERLVRLMNESELRLAYLIVEEETAYNAVINHPDYKPMVLNKYE